MAEEKIQVLSSLIKAIEFHLAEMQKAYDKRDIESFEQAKNSILEAHTKIRDILS